MDDQKMTKRLVKYDACCCETGQKDLQRSLDKLEELKQDKADRQFLFSLFGFLAFLGAMMVAIFLGVFFQR